MKALAETLNGPSELKFSSVGRDPGRRETGLRTPGSLNRSQPGKGTKFSFGKETKIL